ncbi:zinc-ribbon domain-containing protein [Candidatus Bathyarchaeota archaeon]|nr:zinc-ribbon domain-containing protein [Candidatus Bathyarchaeota archaeon]
MSNFRYCPYCGNQIPLDATYCPYCGGTVTPISLTPSPRTPTLPPSATEARKRPLGVIFLILLMALRGVFSLFLGMIWIIAALIYFIAVYGLWRMKGWGGWLTAVLSIVGIIYNTLVLFSHIILSYAFETTIVLIYIPAIVLDLIVLVYLYSIWKLFK